MTAETQVTRVRRTYNKWVANQTLEDFALRFTAQKVRRWSPARIANTAIGGASFLALEAIGGSLTLSYGFTATAWAVLSTCIVIFLMGIPIAYNAAKYGVDIDLLTRGAGFGYLGSTITSLIYASFTFIFFAIEAAIMATALELCFGLPLSVGYVVSALVVIPFVTFGVTVINRFQAWTQPAWLLLQVSPFVFIGTQSVPAVREWTGYTGLMGEVGGGFSLTLFGAASAVMFSLMAQIGEQVDYLRFLPRHTHGNRLGWWVALIGAGPGWIIVGGIKVMAGSFLAYYAFRHGVAFESASDPTEMYLVVFGQMLASPELTLALTGIFVVVCQLKINVTNTYAGSIAWSNFFSRLTHSHPGRVVWVVFNVLIGLILMEFGIYKALEQILGLYSILAIAWLAAIVADLTICKPLRLSPRHIEFKRAHLYDINPVGFGGMSIAILLALLSYLGTFGPVPAALYSYVALLTAFIAVPLIAWGTGGRFYLARQSRPAAAPGETTIQCRVCEHRFEPEDMAGCPVYGGPICSLCCSLDARCGDRCKTEARVSDQLSGFATALFPEPIAVALNTWLGRYLGLLLVVSALMAAVLMVFNYHASLHAGAASGMVAEVLGKLFVVFLIIAGIVVWLFVLAHESRAFAEEEARRHTALLQDEIDAHQETDRQLQRAKEAAESANLAKSRYVTGLSHELRSPLNSILGYAQLLERQRDQGPIVERAARTILRSGEHLSALIEGLLDISKIEAGKLYLYRDKTALLANLNQLVEMFSLQAREKGIDFVFDQATPVPEYVYTDEKRLRQILINLVSNAVKFTERGIVTLRVSYRSQIATFEIIDTGLGIAPDDLERIFLPFQRGTLPPGAEPMPGTGLGLTITKLLIEIMGGEITVESTPGEGTRFTVRLLLSSTWLPDEPKHPTARITGYYGRRQSVLVADDDPAQRQLLTDVLGSLGFEVLTVADGRECVRAIRVQRPDLLILDVSMPRLNGWQVAQKVRGGATDRLPIIMISADAGTERLRPEYGLLHDGYLIKPFKIDDLVQQIGTVLALQWIEDDEPALVGAGQ